MTVEPAVRSHAVKSRPGPRLPGDDVERLSAILAVQQDIANVGLDLQRVMQTTADRAQQLTGAIGGAIALVEGDELVVKVTTPALAAAVGARLKIAETVVGECTNAGAPTCCEDTTQDSRADARACLALGGRSMLVVPLANDQVTRGVLKVVHAEPSAFGMAEEHTLQLLAGFAGAAMAHAAEFEAKQALVSEREAALAALTESERRFRALVEHASDVITVMDTDGYFRYVSPSADRVLGYRAEELVGLHCAMFLSPATIKVAKEQFRDILTQPGLHPSVECKAKHRDGSWRVLEAVPTNRLDDPVVRGIVFNVRDVTDHKAIEKQLLHDALHDSLTHLPNRALFMDRLGQSVVRSKRHKQDFFAVLFLDLDRFKNVNDSLGHIVGDQLLVAIARRLESALRTDDTLARLGGDEFGILLEGLVDPTQPSRIAERLHQKLAAPFRVGGYEVFMGASIGIVPRGADYDHPDGLLRDADTAMYRAKALGRGRSIVFDMDMHAHAVALLQLEQELRRGLERGEFHLQYQPIVRLRDQTIICLEALVRWQHPQRGVVYPDQFIPLAEETGLIMQLGRLVLREGCSQLRAWQRTYRAARSWALGLNLSSRQFAQPYLMEQIDEVLAESGLSSEHLWLEITESAIVERPEAAHTTLAQLRARQVRVSLDDFGTGYSSLSVLQRLPIDTLKIDRSFVSRLSGDGAEIVRTIVSLAHNLGKDVTAEGVEREDQLKVLQELRCDYGQGYLFSAPVSADQVPALIRRPL